MFREKTNDSHVKNDIFPKVRKCPHNIDSMLNITEKRSKYLLHIRFTQKVKKLLTLKQKKAD